MVESLILLHGIWMRGVTMTVLQYRLEGVGCQVETFDYFSVAARLEDTLTNLRRRIRAYPDGVHVVGHSLGGMLALLACDEQSDLPPGRIVCMASPLTGSAIARQLGEHGAGWLLGRSREVLEQGLQSWDGPREVGVIAGEMSVGLGSMLGRVDGPNDGTVAVAETRLPGLSDHCVVAASHTGILFSREAATQVEAFLRHGQFRHET